jgi:hypothetical protein
MVEIQILPSGQSSTPSFGQTHDIFNGLTTLANSHNEIEKRVMRVELICEKTDTLVLAYKDLHSKRIVFLVTTTVAFLVFSIVCMFLTGIPWGSYDWILKLVLGVSSVGLVIEALWFPNKIKEIDRSVTDGRKTVDRLRTEVDELKAKIEKISTQQAGPQTNSTKKSSGARGKTGG